MYKPRYKKLIVIHNKLPSKKIHKLYTYDTKIYEYKKLPLGGKINTISFGKICL